MKKVLIISTGGTFNKIYNPINGKLEIDRSSKSLEDIASKWLYDFEVVNIIGKDSLEMNDTDRKELLGTLQSTNAEKIIIIHGTDTMDITAQYLDNAQIKKTILLTGAMVPYSINPVEATANLASAYGYLNVIEDNGVFIAMNGVFGSFKTILKDRKNGKFILLPH